MSNEAKNEKYDKRRWRVPHKRATKYATDRKAGVHTAGPKEGQELNEFEKGIRSGYLQCQSDHAALFKYKDALARGKTKAQAKEAAIKPYEKPAKDAPKEKPAKPPKA